MDDRALPRRGERLETGRAAGGGLLLGSRDDPALFAQDGGGKAANLARLTRLDLRVPAWFCLSARAFDEYVGEHGLQDRLAPSDDLAATARRIEDLFLARPLPARLTGEIRRALELLGLGEAFVAVRSSGIDEDSETASFAGQFSSFLHQRGEEAISTSIRRCWASGFSERALAYRRQIGLPVDGVRVAVVVQEMVEARAAGVAFSRNPAMPLERDQVIVEAVYGLGEGLVGGALEADRYAVHRETLAVEAQIACKTEAFRRGAQGGVVLAPVPDGERTRPALSQEQAREAAALAVRLEEEMGAPQDCEWAVDRGGVLFALQTRPITSLPPAAFYDQEVIGATYALWDNANIIESYEGITSPLTFSFASRAYRQVYIQFCEIMGIPQRVVDEQEEMFRNMLGLIRGRIYYNLINWYRLVRMLPVGGRSDSFMETMMGVRQSLGPELATLFEGVQEPPRFSPWQRLGVTATTVRHFIRLERAYADFQERFAGIYEEMRRLDFGEMPLNDLLDLYASIEDDLLKRWHAPIINDYLCMIFFGILKRLTERWVCGEQPDSASGAQIDRAVSLQNDLLCGEGDLVSTAPTRMLMKIAEVIDRGDRETREWFTGSAPEEVWRGLAERGRIGAMVQEFLDLYGFRCVNELKLEAPDLHDDPTFVIGAVARYVRAGSYDAEAMTRREAAIRQAAEEQVDEALSGWKRWMYLWVLKQARRTVRQRENLRFDRTKIFGLARRLFRGVGRQLTRLRALRRDDDVFYLTLDEIFAYVEGRSVVSDLAGLVALRRREYGAFRRSPAPPDRFLTRGATGVWAALPQLLAASDLLRGDGEPDDDPNLLRGTPCCPGVVEGVVRVARSAADAEGLDGEILVTARTDPGWAPLYPSCSGLLIERGSLLSHSAVVARELGLPTVVGIPGGLMDRLETGQRVRMDGGTGEVRIL